MLHPATTASEQEPPYFGVLCFAGKTATAFEAFDLSEPGCGMYTYCYSTYVEWALAIAPESNIANPQVALTIKKSVTKSQDTDWSTTTTTSVLNLKASTRVLLL